jgi:hypothetical protein
LLCATAVQIGTRQPVQVAVVRRVVFDPVADPLGQAVLPADDAALQRIDHVATIDPADLDEAAELTAEQEYATTLGGDQEWAMQPDGSRVTAEDDPTRRGAGVDTAGRARGSVMSAAQPDAARRCNCWPAEWAHQLRGVLAELAEPDSEITARPGTVRRWRAP